MQTKTVLLTAFAAFSSVADAGYAQVRNKCTFPIYLWSATPTATSQKYTLAAGSGSYQEAYQALPSGVSRSFNFVTTANDFQGVAIKVSRYSDISALYNGSALTQDQYTLNGALVWYNLADTGGDPFLGYKVTLVPSDPASTSVVWANGQGPSQILNTGSANNLTLTLCA